MKKTRIMGAALAMIIAIEAVARLSGVTDFPVYDVDNEIGYLPKANQSGSFLRTNDWYFNDKSMPIARDWDPDRRPNILLIGNSIVMGGNPYRQQDKLAPQIQARLGDRPMIWPIAAGGWTQINEMIYLNRHAEVVGQADYFAWEYMQGGLSGLNPWGGDYVFPSRRPVLASWYVLRRYFLSRFFVFSNASELPVTGAADQENLRKFDRALVALKRRSNSINAGIIWLFPTASQLDVALSGGEWLPERMRIVELAERHGLRVIDIAASKQWKGALYRDDGVHPTIEGNSVLASILSEEFAKDKVASCPAGC